MEYKKKQQFGKRTASLLSINACLLILKGNSCYLRPTFPINMCIPQIFSNSLEAHFFIYLHRSPCKNPEITITF